jgi:hypothetical protein
MAKELLAKKATGKLVIAILDRGWVFIGRATEDEFTLTLGEADCIRVWGTTKGIGQLALEGKQASTVLDPAGTVAVPKGSVVALIDARDAAWPDR